MVKNKLVLLIAVVMLLVSCSGPGAETPEQSAATETIRVVATTTILGDVVAAIGGDHIDLTVLFPRGADVHRFDPTAADARAIADADLVFVVGLELDHFVEDLVPEGDGAPEVVDVSAGISAISMDADGDAGDHEGEDGHDHEGGLDPHVWLDPNNVIIWVENIVGAMADIEPEFAGAFDSAAAIYIHSLIELDSWIEAETGTLPAALRKLVTDHDSLRYFARRYGFELVGFIIPGFSTLGGASAQELSGLIDTIAAEQVSIIFVDPSFDPGLTGAVADGAGVRVATLYTGALTQDGQADTYLELMTYNTNTIVTGLKGE